MPHNDLERTRSKPVMYGLCFVIAVLFLTTRYRTREDLSSWTKIRDLFRWGYGVGLLSIAPGRGSYKRNESNISILCYVTTSPKYLEERASYVKSTWSSQCNKTLFISDDGIFSVYDLLQLNWVSKENLTFPTIEVTIASGYNQLWAKTRNTLELLYQKYFNDYEWFLKADDDTYVIMNNLRRFLFTKNSSEMFFYGKVLLNARTKRGFASGGAGYVFSKAVLSRLVNAGFKERMQILDLFFI
ncbi:glycoprotein-N-acetylgalactosamine 3-beta-galactosyltransferase 1-like [Convolutriloba macropyga]|uniref:glycoprotein-N-acetylgalactosamine 3-beta-galactosyltransferase 1-like n=1 Tax=Convolutriloba macropyga TaxID=536237 RepID=UPI003F520962